MYGCAVRIENKVYREAPPLGSAQVRSWEHEMTKEKSKETRLDRDWLTVTEACKRADVSPNTIKNWVAMYGIGLKVAGRFRILPDRLDEILRGETPKRLP